MPELISGLSVRDKSPVHIVTILPNFDRTYTQPKVVDNFYVVKFVLQTKNQEKSTGAKDIHNILLILTPDFR